MKSDLFDVSLLLSAAEVEAVYMERNTMQLMPPIIFEWTKGDQRFCFVGFSHSNDPKDEQFPILEDFWQKWVSEIDKSASICFVEGGVRPVEETKDEAIKKHSEAGLLTYWANKEGITCESPEPDEREELLFVANELTREEVMYYYFARVVHQWQWKKISEPVERYLAKYLKRYKELSGWEDFDFSFQHFISLHNARHDHSFNPKRDNCFYFDSAPAHNPNAKLSSDFRDIHIVEEILNNWKMGKSIFIVYGSGHLVKQQRVMEKLLK